MEQLLTEYFDIVKPISFFALKKIPQFCDLEPIYLEKIEEMDFEDYTDYVLREKRKFAEICFDFKISRVKKEFFFECFECIRPREYSVAGLDFTIQNQLSIALTNSI